MYRKVNPGITQLQRNTCDSGEPIERRVERIMNNNEPISDGAPIIYTDRKDGVDPLHNIRTDRFELAIEATQHITQNGLAKRDANQKLRTQGTEKPTAAKATESAAPTGNPA